MNKLFIVVISFSAGLTYAQPNIATTILMEKNRIDKQVEASRKQIQVLVKLKGSDVPLKITGDTWPEDIERTYNILKDSAGHVIYFAEIPVSESGDWSLELKHYFSHDGQTIAFEKWLRYFNEDCGDGLLTESATELFVGHFEKYATLLRVTDGTGNAITDANCRDPYSWEIDKRGSAFELLALKKIML
jgi:hypothetical protein